MKKLISALFFSSLAFAQLQPTRLQLIDLGNPNKTTVLTVGGIKVLDWSRTVFSPGIDQTQEAVGGVTVGGSGWLKTRHLNLYDTNGGNGFYDFLTYSTTGGTYDFLALRNGAGRYIMQWNTSVTDGTTSAYVNGDFYPAGNLTYNLGTSAFKWNKVYTSDVESTYSHVDQIIMGHGSAGYIQPTDSNGQIIFRNVGGSVNLLPYATTTLNLGASTSRANKIWVKDIDISGTCTGCGGLGAPPVTFQRDPSTGDVIRVISDLSGPVGSFRWNVYSDNNSYLDWNTGTDKSIHFRTWNGTYIVDHFNLSNSGMGVTSPLTVVNIDGVGDVGTLSGSNYWMRTRHLELWDSVTGSGRYDFIVHANSSLNYMELRNGAGLDILQFITDTSDSTKVSTMTYGDIFPDTNNTHAIGTPSNRFASIQGNNFVSYNSMQVVDNLNNQIFYVNTGGIQSNLKPYANNAYDIGTASVRWRSLYLASSLNTNSYVNALSGYQVNGTSVIDSGRNAYVANLTITGTCTGCGSGGSAPANMVTTDTNQTITGQKTFNNSLGTYFQSKVYTQNLEPVAGGTGSGVYNLGSSTVRYAGVYAINVYAGCNGAGSCGGYTLFSGVVSQSVINAFGDATFRNLQLGNSVNTSAVSINGLAAKSGTVTTGSCSMTFTQGILTSSTGC